MKIITLIGAIILYLLVLPIYTTIYILFVVFTTFDFSFFLNFRQDGILNPLFIIGLIELIIIIRYVRIIFSKMLRYLYNKFKYFKSNLW